MKPLYFWLLLALSTQTQASECPGAPFRASFLQPLTSDLERSSEAWQATLQNVAGVGMDALYLQWSLYGELDLSREPGIGFLKEWLDQAHSSGLRVHVGLVADADFGSRITGPADELAPYLADLRERSLAAADRLDARLGDHPAFAGWYLSEEIDDRSWAHPWQVDLLREHLRSLNGELSRLSPEKAVSISTYVSGAQSPAEFERLWRALWAAAPQLRVLLQDGAGVGTVARPDFDEYALSLNNVAARTNRYWGMILELFAQQSGPPLDDEAFSAHAAPISRVQHQLGAIDALDPGPNEIIAFSVPEYMLDPAMPGQSELLSQYRRLYCRP